MKTLSVRQPWAWLIVYGGKDIENRSWRTPYRGPLLIHAGKRIDQDACDCVTTSDSRWFEGPYGWVLANARPLPFEACNGKLGLFEHPAPSPG